MAMVVGAVLVCGVVLGGMTTSLLREEPAVSASATPSPAVSPSATHAAVEVPGEDIDRLPRYPGSVRTHGEILAEIVDESERMSRLVDDLLFWRDPTPPASRLSSSGYRQINSSPVSSVALRFWRGSAARRCSPGSPAMGLFMPIRTASNR